MSRRTTTSNGWSRPALLVVFGHSLLLQMVTFCFRPSLSYAALESGLGVEWLGLFSAAFAVPGLALAIPAGILTDRVGERIVAVVGGISMLAGITWACVWPHSIVALLAGTVLFGSGHLLAVVAGQAILANKTHPTRRDGIFGAYAFTIALGQGLGAGLLAIGAGGGTTPDLSLQFIMAVAIGVAVLFAAILMRRSRHDHPTSQRPVRLSAGTLLRRPFVFRAIVASSLVVTAVEISLVYFPSLGYERGYPAWVVSAMLVGRSLAAMASRIGLSIWVRVFGRRRLMVWSVAISAVALAAIALPVDPIVSISLCAAFGFFNGVSQPLTLSWLSEVAPAGTRGTVMSLRIASVRISQATIPPAIGTFSAVVGAGGVLVAVATLVGFASWLATAIGNTPHHDPPPGEES